MNKEFAEKLANMAASLNRCNGQVVELRTGVADLNSTQPWRKGLDWLEGKLETEIGSAAKERAEAEGDITLLMGTFKKQEMDTKNLSGLLEKKNEELDHLKREMDLIRNYSQSSLHTFKKNVFSTITTLQGR